MNDYSPVCETAKPTETPEKAGEIMSRKATAKYLGICVTTLDRLSIPKTRIGRRVMYTRDVLNKWIAGNTGKIKRGKA